MFTCQAIGATKWAPIPACGGIAQNPLDSRKDTQLSATHWTELQESGEWLWQHCWLLTEKKDVYIPIRSTSLPEVTVVQLGHAQLNPQLSLDSWTFSYLCRAEPATSWRVAAETRPIRNKGI
jgi:hypothetical protein